MGYYFPDEQSALAVFGGDTAAVIRRIGQRYMWENPPVDYVYRAWDLKGIATDRQYRYIFDFDRRFPSAVAGDTAVAVGELYCAKKKDSRFCLYTACPVKVLVNGQTVYVSDGVQADGGERQVFPVSLAEGFNRFVMTVEKTASAFSAWLQNAMPQWEPCHFVMPFSDRLGESGFLYRLIKRFGTIPPDGVFDKDMPSDDWLPEISTQPLNEEGQFAALMTAGISPDTVSLLSAMNNVTVMVDGKPLPERPDAERHTVLLRGTLDHIRRAAGMMTEPAPPVRVYGRCTPFLVLGPVRHRDTVIRDIGCVTQDGDTPLVWRTAYADIAVRPFAEAFLFGRWSYPLGVTLYGMLESSRRLKDPDMAAYVSLHEQKVIAVQAYAEWETARYGFAGVNEQLCWLDALDDCGSFASFMLEYDRDGKSAEVSRIAGRIADYIVNEQPREEHGAFCRRDQTIWADDMYMSVPFLCRYAQRTGDTGCIDLAAEQLLWYRALLFMPQKGLMAHMLSLSRGCHNAIPWSRGNGWVIFALSELLMRMPSDHPRRRDILSFFTELTEGYLSCQDESGMWHQILDDPASYPETSATAMMISAFSRGVRLGLYGKALADAAEKSALKAWQALKGISIDRNGNVYGVCRGSGFSYSRDYYRSLSWNDNDTHGIGIVMLAGCEILSLKSSIRP